jgi:hypothetical protein
MPYFILPYVNSKNSLFGWGEDWTRSWYHESVTGSRDLLITVGDSWTWGDSLGKINLDLGVWDDPEYRTQHVFGNLLSQKLNRDFLLLAKCGATNSEIHDFAFRHIDYLKTKYDKITVVITLTELCREITGDDWWLDPPPSQQSLNAFLADYESNMLRAFQRCMAEHPDVQWVWARNFTNTYVSNLDVCPNSVEKTWVQVLGEAQSDMGAYPSDARMVTQLAFVPLEEYLQSKSLHRPWRRDLYEQMCSASLAIDWLMDSELNYKKASKHPTEAGHQLWADYLYQIITNK